MDTAIQKIETHLFSQNVLAKFVGVLDKSAIPYMRSVMIAVEADPQLQKCTPDSISISALRAASLQLSCDTAAKQAYLLPYWNNKKQCYEAQFHPHYLGLYALAVRTNKYRVIEVTPFPGEYHMELDLSTGTQMILNGENKPAVYAPKVDEKDAGAWYGYLRTRYSFEKKIWMTKQEIHEHAKKFNPKGYNAAGSLWKNPNQVATMEKKTVLRELLNWADKSGYGDNSLREALSAADDVIDVESTDVEQAVETQVNNPEPVQDDVTVDETKAEEEQKAEEPKADEQKYSYNSDTIIDIFMKKMSMTHNDAVQTVYQARKRENNPLPKMVTKTEAGAFCDALLGLPQ